MTDTPPSTTHGLRPAVAIVMSPIQAHAPLGRGCTVTDSSGALHRMTASVVHAIDFYPATPTNHQPKGTRE